jgi:uncharacterized protein YcfL
MKKLIMCCTLMAAFLLTTGCASIFSKSTYQVNIQTTQKADRFEVINVSSNRLVASGTQSKVVPLDASSGFLEKARYQVVFYRNNAVVERRNLNASFDGITAINIFFLPGFLIDAASGAFYRLPSQI